MGPDCVPTYDPTLEEVYWHETIEIGEEPIVIECHKARLRRESEKFYQSWELPWLKHMLQHCDACVLVYSSTNRRKFDNLRKWWAEVTGEPGFGEPLPCKHLYVAHNKMDRPERREVSLLEGNSWCVSISAQILPMSARTGWRAEGLGLLIAERILLAQRVVEMPELVE